MTLSACVPHCNCVLPVRDASLVGVLEAEGFTDVKPGHIDPLGCSDSDDFAKTFTATSPRGKIVSGSVCCGWWKSCTVRIDP